MRLGTRQVARRVGERIRADLRMNGKLVNEWGECIVNGRKRAIKVREGGGVFESFWSSPP